MEASDFISLAEKKLMIVSHRMVQGAYLHTNTMNSWVVELFFKDRKFSVNYRSCLDIKFSLSEETENIVYNNYEVFETAESAIDRIYDLYRNDRYMIEKPE